MEPKGEEMNIERQVEIIENQILSPHANFTLIEKMIYLLEYFDPDPEYSKKALDIVRANICKKSI